MKRVYPAATFKDDIYNVMNYVIADDIFMWLNTFFLEYSNFAHIMPIYKIVWNSQIGLIALANWKPIEMVAVRNFSQLFVDFWSKTMR